MSLLLGEHAGNNPYHSGNYYFTNTGAERRYWFGSQYVCCDSEYVDFGVRYVGAGGYVSGLELASSYGTEGTDYLGVLSVVSLKSGVQLKPGSQEGEWSFVD